MIDKKELIEGKNRKTLISDIKYYLPHLSIIKLSNREIYDMWQQKKSITNKCILTAEIGGLKRQDIINRLKRTDKSIKYVGVSTEHLYDTLLKINPIIVMPVKQPRHKAHKVTIPKEKFTSSVYGMSRQGIINCLRRVDPHIRYKGVATETLFEKLNNIRTEKTRLKEEEKKQRRAARKLNNIEDLKKRRQKLKITYNNYVGLEWDESKSYEELQAELDEFKKRWWADYYSILKEIGENAEVRSKQLRVQRSIEEKRNKILSVYGYEVNEELVENE